MDKELLTVEFRYNDAPKGEYGGGYERRTLTVGVYDNFEDAMAAGNKTIEELSKHFTIRACDRFKVRGLFGSPDRLVSNFGEGGVQFFAKIDRLKFDDINNHIAEAFAAVARKRAYNRAHA